MRINHNISAMTTQGSLFQTNRKLGKSLERLSTGLRINSAADDAAGLAISENLRTQVRGTAQARRNALDGIAAMNIAEGSAREISDILQRMRELAIQSSNDTMTSSERSYTNQEFKALTEEIDRIAGVTNYNGLKLMSGATGSNRFGAGSVGSTLWIDANSTVGSDSITVTLETMTTSTNGLSITAHLLTSATGSANAISALSSAIDSVNKLRSNVGSYINRMEHTINNLTVSNTNQQSAESQIRDADFAHETTAFTRSQILLQSSTAMLSQANLIPQTVLQLLS